MAENTDNRVTISGGDFNVQGAFGVGANARVEAHVEDSGQARQDLPEILGPQEVLRLQALMNELEERLAVQAADAEVAQLQAGLVEKALETAQPRRTTLVGLLKNLSESAKELTGIGEFVARLIRLVSTGVF
ncbi:hypothetical protein [Kineosporia babensis]|uniref:Uncharacterized protein n=1 Tax=Kineosporia babensis TaxID=499548 RepID=A0A9X1T2T3_9ACTN|nr:hypothetical protein [Kineosporia babensis]MCD5314998.1 hypothetical protein [Kineosporia babensis]